MKSALMAVVVLALFFNPARLAAAASDASQKGAAIYRLLQERGLLEDYMTEEVGEIAGTLVKAAGYWPGLRINEPFTPGLLNIYLIDSARLPEANVLQELDVNLSPHSLRDNAMAHEESGIIFVDTALLKSLVVAGQLAFESNVDMIVAVGSIKARGINAFRQLWDPAINPQLKAAGYADQWVIFASGALAFILAHEMGHIYLGGSDDALRRKLILYKDKADKDLHWACSDLIDKKYSSQQSIEQQSDDFAVTLLSKILFPPGVLTEPLLRYDIGARMYIVYSLAGQLIETLYATESQNILTMMRLQLGAELYEELISAKKPKSGKGSIHIFFPKSHPANIRRALVSLSRLNQSPYSPFHNEPSSTLQDIVVMEMLVSLECKNLTERRGRE